MKVSLRLSPDDKKYYFSLHDAFQYCSSEDSGVCSDLETLGRTYSGVTLDRKWVYFDFRGVTTKGMF